MAYERIKCPSCESTFAQESRFLDHLTDAHGIVDHLQLYLDTFCGGVHRTCECSPSCTEKLTWSGWKKGFVSKFIRGHNARVDSVYLDADRQSEFATKRSIGYRDGRYSVWNTGLTKDTSDKLAAIAKKISISLAAAHASGSIVDWRGVDPERAASVAATISKKKKAAYASGECVPWNVGLTKENNASLASASKKISERYDLPEAGRRLGPEELFTRIDVHADKFRLVSSIDDYRRRRVERMTFVCVNCGAEQQKSLAMLEESPICFSCKPRESKGQLEILEFITSLGIDAVSNDRSIIAPMEIDVLVPSSRLAIEYDGLYWHSVAVMSDRRRADKKRIAVESSGHRFLGIYEDEWRDKRSIVEGMIRHRLGMSSEVFNARDLKIEQLNAHQSRDFFESSHLEGNARSSTVFGLLDGAKVVAAMSLRRPFHASRTTHMEVARSACLPGVSVRGWIGRLTSRCLQHAKDAGFRGLMTYVDSRVGSGVGYENGIWRPSTSSSSPRFWWTDFHNRFNRFKYRADSAAGLTQTDVATAAGVVEIWGCGNRAYIAE